MSDKFRLRVEAVLDGVTGVVGVPSIHGVDRYSRRAWSIRCRKRSWTFVGKYLNIAMQEFESETAIATSTSKTDSQE